MIMTRRKQIKRFLKRGMGIYSLDKEEKKDYEDILANLPDPEYRKELKVRRSSNFLYKNPGKFCAMEIGMHEAFAAGLIALDWPEVGAVIGIFGPLLAYARYKLIKNPTKGSAVDYNKKIIEGFEEFSTSLQD